MTIMFIQDYHFVKTNQKVINLYIHPDLDVANVIKTW